MACYFLLYVSMLSREVQWLDQPNFFSNAVTSLPNTITNRLGFAGRQEARDLIKIPTRGMADDPISST